MQVGEVVRVTEGSFNEKGCVGEVVEVNGEEIVVEVSGTKSITTVVSNVETVSELELVIRGTLSQSM